jgi:hypothetical protein
MLTNIVFSLRVILDATKAAYVLLGSRMTAEKTPMGSENSNPSNDTSLSCALRSRVMRMLFEEKVIASLVRYFSESCPKNRGMVVET